MPVHHCALCLTGFTFQPAHVVGDKVYCSTGCYNLAGAAGPVATVVRWQPGDTAALQLYPLVVGRARVTVGHGSYDALIIRDASRPAYRAVWWDKRTHDFVSCPIEYSYKEG